MEPKLDRTFSKTQKLEEQGFNEAYWLTKTPSERLAAAYYLTCCAYGLEYSADHKLDRTYCRAGKLENRESWVPCIINAFTSPIFALSKTPIGPIGVKY